MINQEDKEIKRLLIELGLAVFNAQALEYSMVSLYAATELRGCSHASAPQLRELMDTRYTHTLGRLVRDAALSLDLEADLTQELQKGLQERNWLIHHFYREYAHAAFDAELRRRAISKIESMRANLEKVSQAVHDAAVNRILSTGISQDEMEVEIKQATERY